MSLHITWITIFSGKRSAIIFCFFWLILRFSLHHWFSTVWLLCGICRGFLYAYRSWCLLNSWICELIVIKFGNFSFINLSSISSFPFPIQNFNYPCFRLFIIVPWDIEMLFTFSVFSSFVCISLDSFYWFLCLQVHWSFLQQCLKAPLNLSTKYFNYYLFQL